MITAAHVYNGSSGVSADTWLNGVQYANVPASGVLLANPQGAGYTQYSDLELYRLAAATPLPSVAIGSVRPRPDGT